MKKKRGTEAPRRIVCGLSALRGVDAARVGPAYGEPGVALGLGILRVEIIVAGKFRRRKPFTGEEDRPVHHVGTDEERIRIGEVVVHLVPLRQRAGRPQRVNRVVGGVVLQDGFEDAASLELIIRMDQQIARTNGNLQADIVRCLTDLNDKVLQRGFGQVRPGGKLIGVGPAHGIRVVGGKKFLAVAAQIGVVETAIL